MNGFAFIFLLINAAALLSVPRRWAPLPLLAGACYMTLGQGIEVGPLHFPIIRLLLLFGFARVIIRNERPAGGFNGLDWFMLAWAFWCLFSSIFVQPLTSQLGTVYNTLGIYFLIRIFCQNIDDIIFYSKITAFVLLPVALEMVGEKLTGRNMFAIFGDVPEMASVREGSIRAQGPFSHSILAGTVGAAVLPLMVGIWKTQRLAAKVGIVACLLMVLASRSSGPLMSVVFGLFGLMLWKWRAFTRQMRIAAVVFYIVLDVCMQAPAYYLIARIDLTGSSTGYHRAALIQAAINHFSEWWFAGTAYTRHWMPYGVSWSEDHCDITNQYIGYGVFGGFPLMLLFIFALGTAFNYVGKTIRLDENAPLSEQFHIWTLGAALFAQACSCMSVYYFDQSFVFLFSNLAMIGSLYSSAKMAPATLVESEDADVEADSAVTELASPQSDGPDGKQPDAQDQNPEITKAGSA
ncbi:MAG: hypothetical protein QM715_10465 [Nibricoccus sp.]